MKWLEMVLGWTDVADAECSKQFTCSQTLKSPFLKATGRSR